MTLICLPDPVNVLFLGTRSHSPISRYPTMGPFVLTESLEGGVESQSYNDVKESANPSASVTSNSLAALVL